MHPDVARKKNNAYLEQRKLADACAELLKEANGIPNYRFVGEDRQRLQEFHTQLDRKTWDSLFDEIVKSPEAREQIERIINPAKGDAEAPGSECPRRPKIRVTEKLSPEAWLHQLIKNECSIFRTPAGAAYADIMINGHRETWNIRSPDFAEWLRNRHFEKMNGGLGKTLLEGVIETTHARARRDGNAPVREVFLRVASSRNKHDREVMYIDLCDAEWRVIEVTAASPWRVIPAKELPEDVRFRRALNMQPLPEPVRGGALSTLGDFLNFETLNDYILMVGWLLNVYRCSDQYPILNINGEQGSAKTTAVRLLRALIDPRKGGKGLSGTERDLYIQADSSHVLAFDNLSKPLSPDMSDALCRLATGGSFSTRKLHSDREEINFEFSRPIILVGISDMISRPDLADRAMRVELKPIEEERRRPEKELWEDFNSARPRILGALMDALALGLRELPKVELERNVRMADVMLWGTACESAFTGSGKMKGLTFFGAYKASQEAMQEDALEGNMVAQAIQTLVRREPFEGRTRALLDALRNTFGEVVPNDFPKPGKEKQLGDAIKVAMQVSSADFGNMTPAKPLHGPMQGLSSERIRPTFRRAGDHGAPGTTKLPHPHRSASRSGCGFP
jgi:hypothetical protein